VSKTEQEIERLVEEINSVIGRDPPDQQRELRSYASSLLADMTTQSVQPTVARDEREQRPFGLVAAGLALLLLGSGFLIIIPPIGLTLISLGILLGLWGAISGWWVRGRGDVRAKE
jgi:hypothetical protein